MDLDFVVVLLLLAFLVLGLFNPPKGGSAVAEARSPNDLR